MSPRTRWYLLAYSPAAILALITTPSLAAAGDWLAALTVLIAALAMTFQARSYRSRYKVGWHDGRVDLARELVGDQDTASLGTQAPEPWAPRPSGTVVVGHHHPPPHPDHH